MWDLTDIFKDDKEFEKTIKEVKKLSENIKKFEGCTKDKRKLLNYLKEETYIDTLIKRMEVYVYASYVVDYNNKDVLSNSQKLNETTSEYRENKSFFALELKKKKKEEYDSLFDDKDLDLYKYNLDKIYNNKNSEKNSINYKSIRTRIINNIKKYGTIIVDGKEIEINSSNYNSFIKNASKEIRLEVYNKYSSKLSEYASDIAELLNKQIKGDTEYAKRAGFKNYYEQYLNDEQLSKDIFNNVLKCVESNLDSYHKYFKINRKFLGLSKLNMCDMQVESITLKKEYSIEEAKQICMEAIKPLGEDYGKHFIKIFENKYIDYIPRSNKLIQYNCISCKDREPRVIINYFNDLSSIKYLIHECGHHVHHQYVMQNNHEIYRSISSNISEVASLTNELLLANYMYKNSNNKDEKIYCLKNILEIYSNNLFGSVRNLKILLKIHEYVEKGKDLTVDYLNKITFDAQKEYYGEYVETDKYMGLLWERQSIFFNGFYYLYYIIAIIISTYIVSEIEKGSKDIINKYLNYLSCGSNMDIVDIFKILGIEISDKKLIQDTIEYYNLLLSKYEDLSN